MHKAHRARAVRDTVSEAKRMTETEIEAVFTLALLEYNKQTQWPLLVCLQSYAFPFFNKVWLF